MEIKRVALFYVLNNNMENIHENIELCYIASAMRKNGCEVRLFEQTGNKVDYDLLKGFAPDIIGFSVYFENEVDVHNVIGKCKKELSETVIFIVGHHATLYGTEIMESNSFIDFAIRGEGEEVIINVLNELDNNECLKKVLGITYRLDGKIVKNDDAPPIKNLDDLAFPARDLLNSNYPMALISTSRGCTSNCSFCTNKKFWTGWRGRSAANVVDEIEEVVRTKNYNMFMIKDCSFDDPERDLSRLKSICKEIIDRKLNIFYNTSFRAEFYKKSDETAEQLLIESGLVAVLVGLESGNSYDLKLYNKTAELEDNHNILRYFEKIGVFVIPSFINFNPYSTCERLITNLDFLQQYCQCVRFFTYLDVFFYTPIFKKLKEDQLIVDKDPQRGNYSFNYFCKDNAIYNYRFVDENVGKLANYSKEFIRTLNEQHDNVYTNISFYLERHLLQLKMIQRNVNKVNNMPINQAISSHLEEFKILNQNFNIALASWLRGLIQITSEGWDSVKANQYTTEAGITQLFLDTSRAMANERAKIMKKMYRMGNTSV